jgi:hypothetical protein
LDSCLKIERDYMIEVEGFEFFVKGAM